MEIVEEKQQVYECDIIDALESDHNGDSKSIDSVLIKSMMYGSEKSEQSEV
jgi:hypothetical protein